MHVRISSKDNQSLAQENAALRNENAILKEQLALLQEQFDWLKKQGFGRKTEQTSVIMDGGTQLSLFPEEKEQAVSVPENTITVPEHQRKAKRTHEEWMSSLPIKEVRHEEEHPVCEKCGAEMAEIGEEKTYDALVYVPGEFYVRRHIVKKYKCTKCGQNPAKDAEYPDEIEPCNIRRADFPKPMIPHSFCSPELAAHITYEKFAKAVPLYRQEKDFAAKGIPLLRATMSEWVCTIAERWCLPILEEMHGQLLLSGVIHADETVLQVLHESGRKATTDSRMWVYCNGKMNDRSIIIFEYQQTRGGIHPARFLKDFTGFLICDGYDAYNAVTGAKRCGCWTHTRRYFAEALPKDKSAYSTSVAAKAVSFCDSIYHEEKQLTDTTAAERYEQRLVKVKPLLDAFFSWLEEQNVSGKGKLAKAVRYALNEKKYLYTFLEDGNVPIDNNRAENAVRPFAVGRKNWLFNNTEHGAKCSAILHSIISTAHANGLDAEKYLTELFSQPAGTILLPWRRKTMRLKPEEAGLFYEMFLPLLDYVNENYHVTMESVHFTGERVDPRDAAEVAHFLWERTWIIDDYLAGTALPEEQREIILSWKRCISGTFIIERHLKKGSVFISDDNDSVYLVNGIIDSWEEMFSGIPTPMIVKATLLPFRDVIISDGLVSAFPIRFGRNMVAEFKNSYMSAKKNKTIISRI